MIAQLTACWWLFIVLGLCAGLVSGTLGLGAGAVFVPALVLLWGFGQKTAQGTALAVMVPMTLLGALRYWKNPEVDMNLIIILLIVSGALVGVLAGTELASRLPNQVLRKIFSVFLIIVAVRMFIASSGQKQTKPASDSVIQNNVNVVNPGETKNDSEQR